jgi:hypothetical protein
MAKCIIYEIESHHIQFFIVLGRKGCGIDGSEEVERQIFRRKATTESCIQVSPGYDASI